MDEKRSVIMGTMSEICMRARLVLSKAQKSKDNSVLKSAKIKLDALETEMSQCVSEFNKLMPR